MLAGSIMAVETTLHSELMPRTDGFLEQKGFPIVFCVGQFFTNSNGMGTLQFAKKDDNFIHKNHRFNLHPRLHHTRVSWT